jgi:hypothetical protein
VPTDQSFILQVSDFFIQMRNRCMSFVSAACQPPERLPCASLACARAHQPR